MTQNENRSDDNKGGEENDIHNNLSTTIRCPICDGNMNAATKSQKEKVALMTVHNAMDSSSSFMAVSSIFTNISTMPMMVRGRLMEKIRGS